MVASLEPGIVCHDIERMMNFYIGVLGLELFSDAEATPEMSAKFKAAPHGFRIVRLRTPYGERIKLVQLKASTPVGRPTPGPDWVFENHGIAYLTFIVADIYEVMAHLRAHGADVINQEPVEVRKGFQAFFVADPEGNYIEFVRYADLSSYLPDMWSESKPLVKAN
jgi:catechol 2,3-dioxygenase-like lactoylglutathione lyase family enzyme